MISDGGIDRRVVAIVVAGGSGRRMGGDVSKQYLSLAGAPILAWSAWAFERAECVDEVVLVVPEADLAVVADDIVDAYDLGKVRRIVPGGATRQESAAAGLAAVGSGEAIVLVHDGVRPFVRAETIRDAAIAATECGAAVVAVPVTDTIKRVDERGDAVETIPRDSLRAAQTPQAFRASILLRAIDRARADGISGTDEAMLVERLGIAVRVVPGDAENMKITVREDLARAAEIARTREAPRRRGTAR